MRTRAHSPAELLTYESPSSSPARLPTPRPTTHSTYTSDLELVPIPLPTHDELDASNGHVDVIRFNTTLNVFSCGPVAQQGFALAARSAPPLSGATRNAGPANGSKYIHFVVDSGCTMTCHPYQDDLINQRTGGGETMEGIDGIECQVTCIGDLPVLASDKSGKRRKILLRDVRCVPAFTDTFLAFEQCGA